MEKWKTTLWFNWAWPWSWQSCFNLEKFWVVLVGGSWYYENNVSLFVQILVLMIWTKDWQWYYENNVSLFYRSLYWWFGQRLGNLWIFGLNLALKWQLLVFANDGIMSHWWHWWCNRWHRLISGHQWSPRWVCSLCYQKSRHHNFLVRG